MDKREVAIYLNSENGGRALLGNYVFAADEFARLEKGFRDYNTAQGFVGCYDCAERCPDNAQLVTPKRLILRMDQISAIA